MARTLKHMLVVTGLLAGALTLLSGCGRKADLDPPNMPAEQQNKLSTQTKQTAPDKPFLLDPLL